MICQLLIIDQRCYRVADTKSCQIKLAVTVNEVVNSIESAISFSFSPVPPSYIYDGSSLVIVVPSFIFWPAKSKKSRSSTKVICTLSAQAKLETYTASEKLSWIPRLYSLKSVTFQEKFRFLLQLWYSSYGNIDSYTASEISSLVTRFLG